MHTETYTQSNGLVRIVNIRSDGKPDKDYPTHSLYLSEEHRRAIQRKYH